MESNAITKRTTSEMMLLILSAAAAVLLLPLIYLRYINGEFLMAVVNAIIVFILCFTCCFVYITSKVKTAKILLMIVVTFSNVIAIYVRDKPHLYWLYPTIIAFYYILSERVAGVFCLTVITAVTIKILPTASFVDMFSILLSLCLTSGFSYMIFRNYRKKNEELTLLATIDPLTKTGNRRALDDKLSEIVSEQNRQSYTVSLLLLDLDLFKQINDQHGHAIGDQILIEVTNLITDHTRTLDSLFRYGGEEFIITPIKVELEKAIKIAEKLRMIIAEHTFINNITLTISIGVATYRLGEKPETWIHRADSALYLAKNTGRNKVMSETDFLDSTVN